MSTHGITLDNPQSITIRGNRHFFTELMTACAAILTQECSMKVVKLSLLGTGKTVVRSSLVHLILLEDELVVKLPVPAAEVIVKP